MAEIKHYSKTSFKLESVPVVGRTGTVVDPQCPNQKNHIRCHKVTQTTPAVPARLPKGLVESRCTTNVKIAGEEFTCLLDTGSQVTTIPVSFYNQHFADQPVKSLCDLLQVEGASSSLSWVCGDGGHIPE